VYWLRGGERQKSTVTDASIVRGAPRCAVMLPIPVPVMLLGPIVDQYALSVTLLTARRHVVSLPLRATVHCDGGECGRQAAGVIDGQDGGPRNCAGRR